MRSLYVLWLYWRHAGRLYDNFCMTTSGIPRRTRPTSSMCTLLLSLWLYHRSAGSLVTGRAVSRLRAVPAKIRAPPMDGQSVLFRRGWWVSIDTFPVGAMFCQWLFQRWVVVGYSENWILPWWAPFLACRPILDLKHTYKIVRAVPVKIRAPLMDDNWKTTPTPPGNLGPWATTEPGFPEVFLAPQSLEFPHVSA